MTMWRASWNSWRERGGFDRVEQRRGFVGSQPSGGAERKALAPPPPADPNFDCASIFEEGTKEHAETGCYRLNPVCGDARARRGASADKTIHQLSDWRPAPIDAPMIKLTSGWSGEILPRSLVSR